MNRTNEKPIVVIGGVSGVGKGTVISEIRRMNSSIEQARSDTTRAPRYDANDYYRFISLNQFFANLENNLYVEYNLFSGNYYALNRDEIRRIQGLNLIVLIDCNSTGLIELLNDEEFSDKVVSFYLTAAPELVYERLVNRKSETPESIVKRLREGIDDIQNAMIGIYDYVLVNADGQQKSVAEKILAILDGDTGHVENLDIKYLKSLHEKQKNFYKAKVGEKKNECT